ncbi:MAG: transposase, partial [Synechococcales bacterium]|nr:transposase [Synechococcales bacterium]
MDYFHLYNRRNNYGRIFFQRENYLYFLRLLRCHLVEKEVDLLAYCLMPNHYHLLVGLELEILPMVMKSLSVAYTKAINKRFHRVGALFQGRYRSLPVSNDAYLINLCRYIHLNPVKAGLVDRPEEWEFSSYLEYAGLRAGTLPAQQLIREMVGGDGRYRSFLDSESLT